MPTVRADAGDDAAPMEQGPDEMSLSISDGGVAGGDDGGEEVAMHARRNSDMIPDDMRETGPAARTARTSDGGAANREQSPAPEYNPDKVKSRWVAQGAADRGKTPPLAEGRRTGGMAGGGGALGAAVAAGETTAAAFAHVEDLAPLVLPSPTRLAAGGAPGVRIWTGYVELPGEGTFRGEVQSLQGCGDLSLIVKGTIAVVGKLPSANLEEFFEQLTPSRSRTVTLGLLRLNHASMDELTRIRCKEVCCCFIPKVSSESFPFCVFVCRPEKQSKILTFYGCAADVRRVQTHRAVCGVQATERRVLPHSVLAIRHAPLCDCACRCTAPPQARYPHSTTGLRVPRRTRAPQGP